MLTRLNDHYILTGAPVPTEPGKIAKILEIPLVRPEDDGHPAPQGTPALASRELLVAMAVMSEFFVPFAEGGAIPRHSEASIDYLRRRRERFRHLRMSQAIRATQLPVSFDDAMTFTATSFDGPLAGPEPRMRDWHTVPKQAALPPAKTVMDDNPALMFGAALTPPATTPAHNKIVITANSAIPRNGIGALFADVDPATARLEPNDLWMAAGRVLDRVNELTGKHFRLMNPNGSATPNADLMIARLREGYSEKDLVLVAENRSKAWNGMKMQQYIRPKTIFGKTNFSTYLAETQKSASPTAAGWDNGLNLGEDDAE